MGGEGDKNQLRYVFYVWFVWLSIISTSVQTVQISNVNFRMPWSLEQHIFQFWGCIEFQSWQMQDPSKNVWGEADSPFAPLLDVFDIMGTRMCTRRISMSSFITDFVEIHLTSIIYWISFLGKFRPFSKKLLSFTCPDPLPIIVLQLKGTIYFEPFPFYNPSLMFNFA